MINELMKAATALKDVVDLGADDYLQPLPKGKAFRVWLGLGDDGVVHVRRIDLLTEEETALLKKYAPNKHKSFPAFNLAYLPTAPCPKDHKQYESAFKEWCGREPLKGESFEKYERRIKATFGSLRDKTYDVMKRNKDFAQEVLGLCKEFEKQMDDKAGVVHSLAQLILDLDVELFLKEFSGFVSSKFPDVKFSLKDTEKKSVFLDAERYQEFPMSHNQSIMLLNNIVVHAKKGFENSWGTTHDESLDSFGNSMAGAGALHEDVNIPRLLGQIKIRSANEDTPSLARYGLAASGTHPMGNASRRLAVNALKWLSKLDNEDLTFGVIGKNELLFAYPVEMPQKPPMVAKMLGAKDKNHGWQDQRIFRKMSSEVIGQLKDGGLRGNHEIELFSLRKIDKAKTKVVYSRNLTIDALEVASRTWIQGAEDNLPQLDVLDWEPGDVESNSRMLVEPLPAYPVTFSVLLNVCYSNKLEPKKLKTFKPCDGLDLFFSSAPCEKTVFALSQFIRQTNSYFLDLCVGSVRHRVSNGVVWKGGGKEFEKSERFLLTKAYYLGALGILLCKNGIRKENYMKETAFKLGRFLRMGDEVHKQYCDIVRKGQHPAEYCGSSALTAMQENPQATLAQLAQRVHPYVKWAKAFHGTDKERLVHYWLKKWGEVASELHECNIPERLSVAEKAEVLLGYLAVVKQETVSDQND